MSTTILNEGRHAGEFLVSESNKTRSRELASIAANAGPLPAGAVLEEVTPGVYRGVTATTVESVTTVGPAVAILFDAVGASTSAQACVVFVRDMEFNLSEVDFGDLTDPQKAEAIGQLAARGIIAR